MIATLVYEDTYIDPNFYLSSAFLHGKIGVMAGSPPLSH